MKAKPKDEMADAFSPRLDILPAPQRRLWDELADVPEEFVLYGGTAVGLHLGHRESVDFDFFGTRAFEPMQLLPRVRFLADATVTQRAPDTLSVSIDRGGPVKLSFFGLPDFKRVRPPHIAPDNGLQIASLLDLAGTKAAVVQMRAEAKDYIDVDALLACGHVTLPMALAAARVIYGRGFDPQSTLKALSFFGDGTLRALPNALKERLAKAARQVDLARLPVLPEVGASG